MEIKKFKKRSEVKTESPIEELLLAEFQKNDLYPICQYWIGKYRVDFAFPDRMLIVEANGWEYHKDKKEYDEERKKSLEDLGWKVLEFWGKEIMNQADEIVLSIKSYKPFESRSKIYTNFEKLFMDFENETIDEDDEELKKWHEEDKRILEGEQLLKSYHNPFKNLKEVWENKKL